GAGLRALGARAEGAGLGGVPRLGEIRDPALGPGPAGQPEGDDRPREPDPARASSAAVRLVAPVPPSEQPASARLHQARGGWLGRGPGGGERGRDNDPGRVDRPAVRGPWPRSRRALRRPRPADRGSPPMEGRASAHRARPWGPSRVHLSCRTGVHGSGRVRRRAHRVTLARRRELRELALAWGVQTSYVDVLKERQSAEPDALLRVLQALGAPVATAADIPAALRQRRQDL